MSNTPKIIAVKRKHIKAGKRLVPCECPVALALKEAGLTLNADFEFHHGIDMQYIATAEGTFKTTTRTAKFVDRFDETGKGQPFKFRLIPV